MNLSLFSKFEADNLKWLKKEKMNYDDSVIFTYAIVWYRIKMAHDDTKISIGLTLGQIGAYIFQITFLYTFSSY